MTISPSTIVPAANSAITFNQFAIQEDILKALERAEFKTPTPIQAAALPLALEGRDLLGCAQTGTGKTAAFLIPMIMHLEKHPEEVGLIMAPTREIALQICESVKVLLRFNDRVHGCVLIGGAPMRPQIMNLSRRPKMIIGTPGRIYDHMSRGTLKVAKCTFLVLDEADQMLDMGFLPQIEQIVRETPDTRQTLMFSATMPSEIMKLGKKYLKNPANISVGDREKAVDTLKQKVIIVPGGSKERMLFEELKACVGSTLVFSQTKWKADALADRLHSAGINALSIHGGLTQGQRVNALRLFKSGQVTVLVATDVASRGLHIDNISQVINYDLPTNPESFLHRIGRTARNGAGGMAITLVDDGEFAAFRRIKSYLKNCEIIGEFSGHQNPEQKYGRKTSRFARRQNSFAPARSQGAGRSQGGSSFQPRSEQPSFGRSDDRQFAGARKPFAKKPFGGNGPSASYSR